jgi:hypothetical protein
MFELAPTKNVLPLLIFLESFKFYEYLDRIEKEE